MVLYNTKSDTSQTANGLNIIIKKDKMELIFNTVYNYGSLLEHSSDAHYLFYVFASGIAFIKYCISYEAN